MKKIKSLLLYQKTFVVLIALLLFSLPLDFAYSSITLIVLSVIATISSAFHKIDFNKNFWLPILLYALVLLSLFWTIDVDESFRGIIKSLPFFAVPLLFTLMPPLNKTSGTKILYYFALGVTCFALFFIISAGVRFSSGGTKTVFFYHSLVSPLDLNAIYVSVFTAIALLFLLFKTKKNVLNILMITVLSVFLILLSSKMVIAVTLITILGLGFLKLKKATHKFFLLGFLLLILFSILMIKPIRHRISYEMKSDVSEVLHKQRFKKVYPWTGTSLRLFQARIFYEMLQEDDILFTGYGIHASQEKIAEKQNEYNLYQGFNEYNFHNQYIQIFAELGVFGLLLLLAVLINLFRGFLKHKDLMFLVLFFVMAGIFITESFLARQRGIIFFMTLYCLLFKIYQSPKGVCVK